MMTFFTSARASLQPAPGALPAFAAAPFARLTQWRARRREQRQIAIELATYNDRHLAELGLRRSDIADVARGRFGRR